MKLLLAPIAFGIAALLLVPRPPAPDVAKVTAQLVALELDLLLAFPRPVYDCELPSPQVAADLRAQLAEAKQRHAELTRRRAQH